MRRGGLRAASRAVKSKTADPRREQLDAIRQAIEQEQIIVDGAKTTFWAAIRAKVSREGIIARSRLNGHEHFKGAEERAIWLERFLRYEWIINLVERAPRAIDKLEEKYAKLKSEIDGGSK